MNMSKAVHRFNILYSSIAALAALFENIRGNQVYKAYMIHGFLEAHGCELETTLSAALFFDSKCNCISQAYMIRHHPSVLTMNMSGRPTAGGISEALLVGRAILLSEAIRFKRMVENACMMNGV